MRIFNAGSFRSSTTLRAKPLLSCRIPDDDKMFHDPPSSRSDRAKPFRQRQRSEQASARRNASYGNRSRVRRTNRRSTLSDSLSRLRHRSPRTKSRLVCRKVFRHRCHWARRSSGRLGSLLCRVRIEVNCKDRRYDGCCDQRPADPYCRRRLRFFLRHDLPQRMPDFRSKSFSRPTLVSSACS